MKNTSAVAVSATLAAVLAITPVHAAAQSAAGELSSGSSTSSSSSGDNKRYQMDPNDPSIQTPDKPALGSAYTGSAPISLTLAVLATAAAVQLIVDSVPQIRQAVDDAAAAAGLAWVPGSSEGNRIFDVPAWIEMAKNFQLPALPGA